MVSALAKRSTVEKKTAPLLYRATKRQRESDPEVRLGSLALADWQREETVCRQEGCRDRKKSRWRERQTGRQHRYGGKQTGDKGREKDTSSRKDKGGGVGCLPPTAI